MITIKLPIPATVENEINKQNRLKHPRIQSNTLQYEAVAKIYADSAFTHQGDAIKTNHVDEAMEDDNRAKLKLPNIRRKSFQTVEQAYDANRNEEGTNEEMKRLQAYPYLRKYAEMKSTEKIRRQNSCNFLNIVSVKPTVRSSSRISNKDNNLTMNQDRLIVKDRQGAKLVIEGEKGNANDGAKRNARSTKNQSHTIETSTEKTKHRMSGLPKDSLQPIRDKRKSMTVLKLDRNKITPTYYEWCMLLGLIDGVFSQKEGSATYKAFVGKGNNSVLVKNIIKNRPWWSLSQDEGECQFLWSQSRSAKFLEGLKEGKVVAALEYEAGPKIKLQLTGNCQTGLSDRIRNFVGLGFDKILSKSEKERLSKSSVSLEVSYPLNYRTLQANKVRMHNRLEFNWNLSNKKALYYNLKSYYIAMGKDPFLNIPETYHVQKQGDEEWNNFLKGYQTKGFWIVKPGENSNRGCGIDVVETLDQVREIVRNKSIRANGKQRSHIVQRYLLPFLYNKRKFDIRSYMVVTSINGNLRCYWYEEGYIRTASKEFTTKNLKNRMIHLTNDAVQKYSEAYGKHESGNKLSFNEFQKYLKNNYAQAGLDFFEKVYPRMMELAADAIRSTHLVIDAKHREFSFQIFGLDFMIDDNFNTWLIEVNTNPCLELSCPLLARIIPAMVENALKIAVDPIFPPPKDLPKLRNSPEELFQSNKFSLIFNSREESHLQTLLKSKTLENIVESDEESNCDEP